MVGGEAEMTTIETIAIQEVVALGSSESDTRSATQDRGRSGGAELVDWWKCQIHRSQQLRKEVKHRLFDNKFILL